MELDLNADQSNSIDYVLRTFTADKHVIITLPIGIPINTSSLSRTIVNFVMIGATELNRL
jgi:hypothetical protein